MMLYNEITVKSQEELDRIPVEFEGFIYVKAGSLCTPIYIDKSYPNAKIVACNNSSVIMWRNATVIARGNSEVTVWGNSIVTARGDSIVTALGDSIVTAWDNSTITARENSWVIAHGKSKVTAKDNSTVTAWENSSVIAWENSNVTAWGNVQVCDITENHSISVNSNARIVYMPRNSAEYCDYYGLPTHDGLGTFYKAVRKWNDGTLFSDYDHSFKYKIGEIAVAEFFDNNPKRECSHGIHMAYLDWAYQFGAGWYDLAIIEVEAKLDDIVVPVAAGVAAGKVRAPSVKVIREVPAEEYEKLLGLRR